MKETVTSPPSNTRQPKDYLGSGKQFFPRGQEDSFFNAVGIQPKLNIGQRGDKFEQHADAMADKVVNKKANNSSISQTMPADQNSEEKLDKKEEDQKKDEGTLQRKPMFESEGEFEVQKKENSGNISDASPSIESKINASKGNGSPLDPSTRGEMESGFGNDFSNVRVHTGSEAQQMSKDLNAQAFTHGQDIYFDEGKYNPKTSSGKHLLAHELTHTVQQTGGVQKMVQKAGNKTPDKTKADPSSGGTTNGDVYTHPTFGSIDVSSSKVITIPEIKVPSFKLEFGPSAGFSLLKKGDDERPTDQIQVWEKDAMQGAGFDKKLESKLKAENSPRMTSNNKPIYYLRLIKGSKDSGMVFGTADAIKRRSARPNWNKKGEYMLFDVDHKREYQLGGDHNTANMWLLESSANRSSGSKIKNEINQSIDKVLGPARISFGKKVPETASDAKKLFNITISNGVKDGGGSKKNSLDYWELGKIQNGEQLDGLKALSKKEISSQNLAGSADQLMIYATATGGMRVQIPWDDSKKSKEVKDKQFGKNLKIQNVYYDKEEGGKKYIQVVAFKGEYKTVKNSASFQLDIEENPGVEWGGVLKKDRTLIANALKSLEVPPLSPVKFSDADITEEGLTARGKINTSIQAIQKADIDVIIDGDGAHIEKTFNTGEVNIPSPFKISNSSLTVSVGTAGIALKGNVNFGIKNIGEGVIIGELSKNEFSFTGSFDFDPKLFKGKVDKAGIKADYNNKNGWKIEGDLTFAENAVKGIKSGNIHVEYANEVLKAEGTAETTIKGVKEVTLKIVFGKDEFEIEGGVKIEKLTGIKEGQGTLKIVRKDNEYDFSGMGKITPDIPGIETQVDFEFANDLFTVDASLHYKRDRLEGNLKLGITNQELKDGVPTGKKSDEYTVYGGGSISLTITDESLKVTAGVNFLPNGEVEVTGRIDLPKRFNLFPAPLPKRKQRLLYVPIDIPTPIPIIQIYVHGYLDAEAEIGGGYLDDVFAEVKYNPSHPEEMTITGGMSFNMPAYAQVTAGVEFGVEASLLIASIRGGIDLSATLRLEVPQPILKGTLSWSPANGFDLDGTAKIGIMPSLTFTGAFKITGEIDLLVGSLSKSWEWPFGSMTLSPNAPFGMEFPFKYNKNTPLNLSFNQIKFTYPSVSQLAGSLKDEVVNKINDKLG